LPAVAGGQRICFPLAALGIRYFEDLYFENIWSDEYRGVLRAIANSTGEWVTKSEIREKVPVKETTLNNALAALTKRHILIPEKKAARAYVDCRVVRSEFGLRPLRDPPVA